MSKPGTMTDETILQVRALKKSYGEKTALQGIDLSIGEGEFWGLLGPNGAGKTTTIKLLIGLTRPDSGEIRYRGRDFFRFSREAKQLIGVVPQQSNLDRDLTAYENLYLHTILHGIPKPERDHRIDEALGFAGMSDQRGKQVKTFSGGMKRRLVVVRSLLHQPRILFLDEPTSGLDPQIRRSLWELIQKINKEKKTAVLMTTHYIEEADKLCHRVKIINAGQIIADDTPTHLKNKIGKYVLEVQNQGQRSELFYETRLEAESKQATLPGETAVREVTLEDVYIKLTGKRINV